MLSSAVESSSFTLLEPQPTYWQAFLNLNHQLGKNPDQALILAFQDATDFACSKCGQCCTGSWEVPVSEAYYQQWLAPLQALVPAQEPLRKKAGGNAHFYAVIPQQPNAQRCLFLQPDNLCHIHQQLGPEALPTTCQTYPRLITAHANQQLQFSGLLNSCRTAARALSAPAPLTYRIVPAPPPRPARQQPEMPIPALNLWIGLILDTLDTPHLSLRERQRAMGHALYQLIQQESVDETWIQQVHPQQQAYLNSLVAAPDPQQLAVHAYRKLYTRLFIHPAFAPVAATLQQWYVQPVQIPVLTPEEAALLHDMLQRYLQRLVIGYRYWVSGLLHVVQEHYVWSIYVAAIQAMAVALKTQRQEPLNTSHIIRAINEMERQWTHDQGFFDDSGFQHLPLQESLTYLMLMSDFDLTAPHSQAARSAYTDAAAETGEKTA